MIRLKQLLPIVLFFMLPIFCMTLSCEKDKSEPGESESIILLKTEYKSCKDTNKSQRIFKRGASEPVTINVINDTLQLNLNLEYACCAVFDSKTTYQNDTLFVEIIDMTTEFQKSYCRCDCNYGFRFYFDDSTVTSFGYKINLVTNNNKSGTLIAEGMVAP